MPQPNDAGLDPEALTRLTAAFNRWIDAGRIPGAVLLVERRGERALFEALGAQDAQRGIAMRRDSVFRIYSMTKPIVSVALMRQAEAGKVLLRDPIARYLPAFADVRVGIERATPLRPPTVYDLLRHTAGLTYEWHEPAPVRGLYAAAGLHARSRSNAEQIDRLAALPLMHQPGSIWDYSRATDVLGRVVEVIADRPLGEHLRADIFEPLEMKDTGFTVPPAEHHRIAEPWAEQPGGVPSMPVYEPRVDPKLQSGGGGLLSTADDYARFTRLLLAGGTTDSQQDGRAGSVRLLGRRTLDWMTADHLGSIPRSNGVLPPGHGFGLGFAVKTALGEHTEPGSIGSYGWSGAAGTAFFVDPTEQMAAIVLTQAPSLLDDVRELFRQMVYAAIE